MAAIPLDFHARGGRDAWASNSFTYMAWERSERF